MNRKDVLCAVFAAIDEVNGQLPEGSRIAPEETTPLIGGKAVVDSLGLINFIVAVEQSVDLAFGREIALTNDDELIRGDGPLLSVGTLTDHLVDLLNG
jgi:hypothetical protein